MKIFISSTYNDLIGEREKAISTVTRIGQPITMENWFASNKNSKEVALNKLQECDAVVLIIGSKYGSLDEDGKISITEVEYNTAKSLKLPVFVFLKANSDGNWKNEEPKEEKYVKLDAFKSRLDSEVEKNYRRKFNNPESLGEEIIGAIREYEIENGIIGSRLSAFTSYEEFSKPFLNKDKIFNHSYPLVGRNDFLNQLNQLIKSDNKVAVIYGRGGIGKSKILLEFGSTFQNNHPNWKIRFLREGIPLSGESLRQLPAGNCVIIVDDAHRRTDIHYLLNLVHQYSRFKIIISSRTHGVDIINTLLSIAGFDPSEIFTFPEIKELEKSERKNLGSIVLGKEHQNFLESLIQVSKDSTLVLVVGGRLIAEKEIHPTLLEHDQEFRRTVFDKFQDVLTGDIIENHDKELFKNILSIISILAPIYPENEEFQKSVAEFLDIKTSKLIEYIGILEKAGVLLRRGYSLRITPDVLSDRILYKSCISPNGQSTGFAKEVFDKFWNIFPSNILSNLSELDWRAERSDLPTDLLDEFWNIIETDFKKNSHSRRVEILKYMDKVAYLQPAKVLELIAYALRNPYKDSDTGKSQSKYEYTHQSVLAMLPSLLNKIGHNLEYLPHCCDILWSLGRDERHRPPNFGPAMRALIDLAKYELNKQFIYNLEVLDSVEKWFEDHNVYEYYNSPLDIIDPLFKKEGDSPIFEGPELVFNPFVVPYEETKEIRDKALFLISESSKSDLTKAKLRALKSLIAALRPPPGYYNREVSDEELDQWLPEQLKILEIIENLVKTTKDPIVHIQTDSDLKWYSTYPKQKDIADKASFIINLIPDSFNIRIHKALWNKYDEYRFDEDQLELIKKDKKNVITELLEKIDNEIDLFTFLDQILDNLQNSKILIHPEELLELLSEMDLDITFNLSKLVISDPSCSLAKYVGSIIAGIKHVDKDKAMDLIKLALNTNNKTLFYSIAYNYNNRKLGYPIENDEIEFINKLIDYSDKDVKKHTIESLRRFSDKNKAIDIALSVDIGDDEELADSLCFVFSHRLGISYKTLDDDVLKAIISKFKIIRELNDRLSYLDEFLGCCSSRIPESVIDLFFERLGLAHEMAENGDYNYQAIPFRFEKGLNIVDNPNYLNILKKVRDNVLNDKISKNMVSRIFIEISDGLSEQGLDVLNEWIDSGDEEKIKGVGLLIRDAPVDFLFSNSKFISKLIEASYQINDDCYRSVLDSCFSINNPIDISRVSGGLPLKVVEIRDKSLEVSKEYIKGSPTEKFYSSLKQKANSILERALAEDEERYSE